MTALIVEAEDALRQALNQYLQRAGYGVETAKTYAVAAAKLARSRYDFVLVAQTLPDGDGLDLLGTATRHEEPPASFIVFTASAAVEDRVRGLDLGADDCLAKPFALAELEHRMRNIARHRFGRLRPAIRFGPGFVLDAGAHILRHGPHTVYLSRSQFELLHYLLRHRGRALTRQQLATHIGRPAASWSESSNFIDVHIMNLRKALARFASASCVETINGVGYRVS